MPVIFSWPWVVALIACVLYTLGRWVIRVRRKCFDAFKDTGVPGPPIRSLINGNASEYWKPTQIESLERWQKEYGDVFGFFLGDTPIVVVKDLDMIKEIFVKGFSNFNGRGHILRMYELQPLFFKQLLFCKGQEWRDTRTCMGQFFTPAKLKMVMPSLMDAQRQFIENLAVSAESGAELEITSYCERFTFDVISKTAFGIDTDVQRKPHNTLFQVARAVFPNFMDGFLYHVSQNLYHWPWLIKTPLNLINLCIPNPLAEMTSKAKAVIEFRKQNPEVNRPDMAQILLDNELGRRKEAIRGGANEQTDRGTLTPAAMDTIAANCMSIFTAGFEPTKLALTYWFYLMGKHPNVQERMREEVLQAYKVEGDHLSMETLTSLPYTNQVISEIMRLYPPVSTVTTRCAEKDWRYGKYLIKKGTSVMVPVYQLHHDPQYWVEPEKFDPDRFSPENKHLINPIVYQPFGIGPRECIGQRLALLELASAATHVLRHFRISLGPSQKPHLELYTYSVVLAPKGDVWIKVEKLNTVK